MTYYQNLTLLDDSLEGKPRRRYAAEAERSMHRNMKEARALSKAVARLKPRIEKPSEIPAPALISTLLADEVIPVPPTSRKELIQPLEVAQVSPLSPQEADERAAYRVDSADMIFVMNHLAKLKAEKSGQVKATEPIMQAV